MNNDWNHYSPVRKYPTPAPSPEVDVEGVPLPPGAPRINSIQLPQRPFFTSLHPLLGYANRPCIVYDVRNGPNSASAPHARLEWAHESATNPPSEHITVICHILPGPFIVYPSGKDYDFVTVYDVLYAVHCAFDEAIRLAEHRSNLRSGQDETATTLLLGRHRRGLNVPSGRYTWKGLSDEIAPGKWLLHIE